MSNSAINTQVAQLKIGNVQNQADSTSIYSNGVWSFKNSTALTSVTITDAGNVGINAVSPTSRLTIGTGTFTAAAAQTTGMYTNGTNGLVVLTDAMSVNSRTGTNFLNIDSSGNVGIGTASPGSYRLAIQGSNASQAVGLSLADTGASGRTFTIRSDAGNLIVGDTTGSAERMRIAASGDLQILGRCNIGPAGIMYSGVSGGNSIAFKWSGFGNVIARIDNVLDVTLANVSDYRIKRNIESMQTPALERIAELRPVVYQLADYGTLFKASEEIKEGFIAHELQAVIPSAVEGEKDAENQIQSLKLDALCSVMVKAIQELSAKNDALEARLAALEAKP